MFGTALRDVSLVLIIVGRTIIDNIIITAKRLSPRLFGKIFLIVGTIISIPKKPYTTEGIPARSWTAGLSIFAYLFDAISDKYEAVSKPIGTPIIIDPNVANIDDIIKYKIPYWLLAGSQCVPNKNCSNPISAIAGTPDVNIYTVIIITAPIETHEKTRNITSASFSVPLIDIASIADINPKISVNVNEIRYSMFIEPIPKAIIEEWIFVPDKRIIIGHKEDIIYRNPEIITLLYVIKKIANIVDINPDANDNLIIIGIIITEFSTANPLDVKRSNEDALNKYPANSYLAYGRK